MLSAHSNSKSASFVCDSFLLLWVNRSYKLSLLWRTWHLLVLYWLISNLWLLVVF